MIESRKSVLGPIIKELYAKANQLLNYMIPGKDKKPQAWTGFGTCRPGGSELNKTARMLEIVQNGYNFNSKVKKGRLIGLTEGLAVAGVIKDAFQEIIKEMDCEIKDLPEKVRNKIKDTLTKCLKHLKNKHLFQLEVEAGKGY